MLTVSLRLYIVEDAVYYIQSKISPYERLSAGLGRYTPSRRRRFQTLAT